MFSARSGFWLYEPYFTLVHIDVVWFGVIFSGFNIIAALSAKYLAGRIKNQPIILLGMGVMLAVSFFLPAFFIGTWAVSFIGLQQIVRGIYRPTLNSYINQFTQDKYRATIISVISLAVSLTFASLSPFVGKGVDTYGAITIYWAVGAVTLFGISILSLFYKSHILHPKVQIA